MSATAQGQTALDEMVDGTNRIRPHWRGLLGAFSVIGDELSERARRLDRAYAEEGVSSVLPGGGAAERAWRCDPVPLPLAADEFAALEPASTSARDCSKPCCRT